MRNKIKKYLEKKYGVLAAQPDPIDGKYSFSVVDIGEIMSILGWEGSNSMIQDPDDGSNAENGDDAANLKLDSNEESPLISIQQRLGAQSSIDYDSDASLEELFDKDKLRIGHRIQRGTFDNNINIHNGDAGLEEEDAANVQIGHRYGGGFVDRSSNIHDLGAGLVKVNEANVQIGHNEEGDLNSNIHYGNVSLEKIYESNVLAGKRSHETVEGQAIYTSSSKLGLQIGARVDFQNSLDRMRRCSYSGCTDVVAPRRHKYCELHWKEARRDSQRAWSAKFRKVDTSDAFQPKPKDTKDNETEGICAYYTNTYTNNTDYLTNQYIEHLNTSYVVPSEDEMPKPLIKGEPSENARYVDLFTGMLYVHGDGNAPNSET